MENVSDLHINKPKIQKILTQSKHLNTKNPVVQVDREVRSFEMREDEDMPHTFPTNVLVPVELQRSSIQHLFFDEAQNADSSKTGQ